MAQPQNNIHCDLQTYRAPVFRYVLSILANESISESEIVRLIGTGGHKKYVSFLNRNGLASIVYTHLSKHKGLLQDDDIVREALRPMALASAANYLSQKSTLTKIHKVLDAADISYAVFKGAHVRESAYEQPWLRTTADIDVLVSKKDQSGAIDALRNSGMKYHHNPEVFSHEVTLTNQDTSVDLHWHIMRPGRTRVDMTEILLENCEFANGFWGMNPTATLFVLLTHPAINKYVCSPDASLIKIVDLCLWMMRSDIDHDRLLWLIKTAGMKTAAWSTLYLVNLLTNNQPYPALHEQLLPNYLQRKYIEFWVSKDLPTRYYNHRWLMRTAFSLSLHDNIADMIKAVIQLVGYPVKSKDV